MNGRLIWTPQVTFGLVLILLGLAMTLGNLGYDVGRILDYWPLILIVVGLLRWRAGAWWRGTVWLAFGGLFLWAKLDERVDFEDLWPALLILLGLRVMTHSFDGRSRRERRRERRERIHERRERARERLGRRRAGAGPNALNEVAFFASLKERIDSEAFEGGDVTAILGGCEIDLRDAGLADGRATIDVLAVWGGVDLLVPAHWNVSLEVTPIMGGAEDNRKVNDRGRAEAIFGGDEPHLVIRGLAFMGGVDVRLS